MDPVLEALLEEWFSGRDALGNESARFAKRWRDSRAGRIASRVYDRRLDDLRAHAAKLARSSVNIRYAAGVDGEIELRIELDGEPAYRWRPAGGLGLGRATDETQRARTLDLIKASTDDTGAALSALKGRRNDLLDMQQAGADVAAELSAIAARDTEIRAEHDRMHLERKRVLVAEDIANIEDALLSDPTNVELLAQRARTLAVRDAVSARLEARLASIADEDARDV